MVQQLGLCRHFTLHLCQGQNASPGRHRDRKLSDHLTEWDEKVSPQEVQSTKQSDWSLGWSMDSGVPILPSSKVWLTWTSCEFPKISQVQWSHTLWLSSSNEGQQQQGNKGCCRSSKRSSQAAACLRWNGHWWFGKKKTWSRRMVDNPTTKGPLLRFGPMHLCHYCHGNNYPILQWNCFEKLFHLAVLNVEWLLPRNWNLLNPCM